MAELRALRSEVREALWARALPPDGSRSELLRAIAQATRHPTEPDVRLKFTVAQLLEAVELVGGRSRDPALRAAIVGALGAVNGRSLGKLLATIEGHGVGGLAVVRAGRKGREGVAWQVTVRL